MTSKKIVIGAVLFVLIAGTLGVLAIEQSVKAEYNQNRDPNNPCFISGSTFDTRAQEVACNSYLAQKQQKEVATHNWQNSQRPEEARFQYGTEQNGNVPASFDLMDKNLALFKDKIEKNHDKVCALAAEDIEIINDFVPFDWNHNQVEVLIHKVQELEQFHKEYCEGDEK